MPEDKSAGRYPWPGDVEAANGTYDLPGHGRAAVRPLAHDTSRHVAVRALRHRAADFRAVGPLRDGAVNGFIALFHGDALVVVVLRKRWRGQQCKAEPDCGDE